MDMLPVCALALVGAKVALMVHEAFPAKEAPQVFVCANAAPVAAIVKTTTAVWLFFTVKVVAALIVFSATEPNPCEVGDTVTNPIPAPVNVMVWVAGVALSVITMFPVRAPSAVGLKVMVMTQRLPAATKVPQVLVSAKSPLDTILVTLRAVVVLVLWRVTVSPALVVPTATEP
jgi:hypothetical protein